MIKYIKYKKKILALIIDPKKNNKEVTFFTPKNFTQQVGLINYKKNKIIKPHTHNRFLRKIYKTAEVLIIQKGKIRVDFYESKKNYLFSKVVTKGKIVILNQGSHGFKFIANSSLIEVKQGPYKIESDKVRFNSIDEKKIKIIK
jgi:mannose-6-phosphate isomerase-like protein (cupin superfamily)